MTTGNTPVYYVEVFDPAGNSQRINEQTYRVRSLKLSESEAKADKCVLTVDNFDLSNFDDPVWSHGNVARVTFGYPGNLSEPLDLVIMKVKGFTTLSIECRAKTVLLDTKKVSRTWINARRSDVVAQIARELKFAPPKTFIGRTSKLVRTITQHMMTNAQFLRKLANQQGFEFYVRNDEFHWHERQFGSAPTRTFWYYASQTSQVLDIDIETDVTRRPAKVKKAGIDSDTHEEESEEADNDSDKEREGLAEVNLVRAPDLSYGVLSSSYSPEDTEHSTDLDKERESIAHYRASTRGAVKMTMKIIGDPSVRSGTVINVQGISQALSGNYYVKEVETTITPGSYTADLSLISDGVGPKFVRDLETGELALPAIEAVKSKARINKKPAPVPESVDSPTANDPPPMSAYFILDKDGKPTSTAWSPRQKEYTLADGKVTDTTDE